MESGLSGACRGTWKREGWSWEAGLDLDADSEAPLELTKPVWPKATHCLKHQDP